MDTIDIEITLRIMPEPADEMDAAFLQMLQDADGSIIEFDGTPKFRPDEDHPRVDELN